MQRIKLCTLPADKRRKYEDNLDERYRRASSDKSRRRMKIVVQIDGKFLKEVVIPNGLSAKSEYEYLYLMLHNDVDVRAKAVDLVKVVHVPNKLVNLLTAKGMGM